MKHEHPYFERSVLLVLSAVGTLVIFPFAIYRSYQHDWMVAGLDAAISLIFAVIFLRVYITHKTTAAGFVLSGVFLLAASMTVLLKGAPNALWLYPSMVGVFFLVGRHWGVIANAITLVVVSMIISSQVDTVQLATIILSSIATNIFAYVFAVQADIQQERLSELARKDPLTNALNRRAFEEQLKWLASTHRRKPTAPTLIIFDIDDFKYINDNQGHDAGDKVLLALTQLIQSRVRTSDYLYRIGGEEFAILPFDTTLNATLSMAEEIRHLVEDRSFLNNHKVTISMGVAAHLPLETSHNWFQRADKALYCAKREGKNRACLAEHDPDQVAHFQAPNKQHSPEVVET